MNEQKNKQTTVSVVMCVYNAEKYVSTAIEGILQQTYEDFEFIIVDDCSTDDSLSIIKSYAKKDSRIRIIENEQNLWISKSANKGVKLAKGKYIIRHDADDWSFPERIDLQVKLMESNPSVVLSSTNLLICDENLKPIKPMKLLENYVDIKKALLRFNPMAQPSMIFRRDAFLEIGGYDEQFVRFNSEDYHMILKISTKGEFMNIPKELVKYRLLKSSQMQKRSREAHLSTVFGVLRAYFELGYDIGKMEVLILVVRLIIAFFVPSSIWRFISTRFHG